eukprot:16444553-Heterocapsa_arctica.AAC.1
MTSPTTSPTAARHDMQFVPMARGSADDMNGPRNPIRNVWDQRTISAWADGAASSVSQEITAVAMMTEELDEDDQEAM